MEETIEALVFYFDLIGIVEDYAKDPQVLRRITTFQRQVRDITKGFGAPYSTIVTTFDNVIARINTEDNAGTADYAIIDFAGETMERAEAAGFESYFGAITRGDISIDLHDQMLVSGSDPTDIRIQHLSFLSDPHVRAAFAEKWSAALSKGKGSPFKRSCVWISEEVVPPKELRGLLAAAGCRARALPGMLDLQGCRARPQQWPFAQSKFSAIAPR